MNAHTRAWAGLCRSPPAAVIKCYKLRGLKQQELPPQSGGQGPRLVQVGRAGPSGGSERNLFLACPALMAPFPISKAGKVASVQSSIVPAPPAPTVTVTCGYGTCRISNGSLTIFRLADRQPSFHFAPEHNALTASRGARRRWQSPVT
jgi:hypothetical protein